MRPCRLQVITGCFAYELGVVKPNWADVGKGFIPKPKILTDRDILYAAIGILGATVMPHNLFLHSSVVQTRQYPRTSAGAHCAWLAGPTVGWGVCVRKQYSRDYRRRLGQTFYLIPPGSDMCYNLHLLMA